MRLSLTLRAVALCAASLILTSCGARSSHPVDPVARPAPVAPDARLCAALKPEPATDGAIVQPVTPEEREATRRFLMAEAAARDWGREGWERAAIGRRTCRPRDPG